MTQDYRARVLLGEYIGKAVYCRSTRTIGYQRGASGLVAVFELQYETELDGVLTLYTTANDHRLRVECPPIDVWAKLPELPTE